MRIAVISDTHLTAPDMESQSLFPRQLAKMKKEEANRLYDSLRLTISKSLGRVAEWLFAKKPWDLIVHLGDVTGGWQEQGCAHPLAQEEARKANWLLKKLCPKVRYCLGNHDLGYSHPGSLLQGGLNEESLDACKEIFGHPVMQSGFAAPCKMIGAWAPLFEYKGDNGKIINFQGLQKGILETAFLEYEDDEKAFPFLFFFHTPFLPKSVKEILRKHRDRFRGLVYGDLHNPRYEKILRLHGLLTGNPFLRKSHLCPSVAPLWWRGCGLLEINTDQAEPVIRRHLLTPPEEARNLPTASALRCLLWMLRPR